MRLIDADKMRENLMWCKEQSGSNDSFWDDVIERLDVQPTIDAVEVIRCKNCLYWTCYKLTDGKECEGVCDIGEERCMTFSDGYCYWAEEAIRIDAD